MNGGADAAQSAPHHYKQNGGSHDKAGAPSEYGKHVWRQGDSYGDHCAEDVNDRPIFPTLRSSQIPHR